MSTSTSNTSLSTLSTSSTHSYDASSDTSSDELTSSSSQGFHFKAGTDSNIEDWHSNEKPPPKSDCISTAKYSAAEIKKDLSSPSEVCLDRATKLRRSEARSSSAFTGDQKVQSAPTLAKTTQHGSKSIPTCPIPGAT